MNEQDLLARVEALEARLAALQLHLSDVLGRMGTGSLGVNRQPSLSTIRGPLPLHIPYPGFRIENPTHTEDDGA